MTIKLREPILAPTRSNKWVWMMKYCQINLLPPAVDWVWNCAEKAYEAKLNSGFNGALNTKRFFEKARERRKIYT